MPENRGIPPAEDDVVLDDDHLAEVVDLAQARAARLGHDHDVVLEPDNEIIEVDIWARVRLVRQLGAAFNGGGGSTAQYGAAEIRTDLEMMFVRAGLTDDEVLVCQLYGMTGSLANVAAVLGIAASTVRSRWSRARRKVAALGQGAA